MPAGSAQGRGPSLCPAGPSQHQPQPSHPQVCTQSDDSSLARAEALAPCREGAIGNRDLGFSLAPPSHSEQCEPDFTMNSTATHGLTPCNSYHKVHPFYRDSCSTHSVPGPVSGPCTISRGIFMTDCLTHGHTVQHGQNQAVTPCLSCSISHALFPTPVLSSPLRDSHLIGTDRKNMIFAQL